MQPVNFTDSLKSLQKDFEGLKDSDLQQLNLSDIELPKMNADETAIWNRIEQANTQLTSYDLTCEGCIDCWAYDVDRTVGDIDLFLNGQLHGIQKTGSVTYTSVDGNKACSIVVVLKDGKPRINSAPNEVSKLLARSPEFNKTYKSIEDVKLPDLKAYVPAYNKLKIILLFQEEQPDSAIKLT